MTGAAGEAFEDVAADEGVVEIEVGEDESFVDIVAPLPGRGLIHLVEEELAIEADGFNQGAGDAAGAGVAEGGAVSLWGAEVIDVGRGEDLMEAEMTAGGMAIKDAEEVAVEGAGEDGAGPVFLDELAEVDDAVGDEFLLAAVVVDDFGAL